MPEDVQSTEDAEDAEAAPAGATTSEHDPGFLGTTWHGIKWLFWRHLAYVGLVGALIFFLLSLTPSLLPRHPFFQGLVSGVAAAIGYGVGSAVSAIARRFVGEPAQETKRLAWWSLLFAAIVLIPILFALASDWQNTVRALMDMEPMPESNWLLVLIITAITGYLSLIIARLVRGGTKGIIWLIDKLLPRAVAVGIGLIVMFLLVIGLIQGVVIDGIVGTFEAAYSVSDKGTTEGTVQSTSSLRSGSPESLVPWETLGNQGRDFAGEGEAVSFDEINTFAGGDAIEPIRVYVGLRSADTLEERVDLAIAELDRTNAWDREVIAVYTTTGTGWIDPKVADSIEYMHAGDVAAVGLQYSYLPSAISILVDREKTSEAAFAMISTVSDRVNQLPEDGRPRLVVFGESLGSYGTETAFLGLSDLTARVDGGMLVGPPWFNPLWGPLTEAREPGTPVWRPIYEKGETVRFAVLPEDVKNPPTPWPEPRLLYLQNSSDPIVWFGFETLLRKPEWLNHPRGPDVSPDMEWYPFVTFFQLAADLAYSTGVPGGHGHKYGSNVVDGWAGIVPPDDWTDADTQRLKAIIGEL